MPRSARESPDGQGRSPERSYQQMVKALIGQILADQLKAGTRLPTERDLARQYGLSRCTVRNAMHVLEERGLVRRVPSQGTFVTGTPGEARWYSSARSIQLIQWCQGPLAPYGFYGRIDAGVRHMAHAVGLELRVETVSSAVRVPLDRYIPPTPNQASGVILSGMIDDQYIGMFRSEGIPVLVIDYRPQRSDVDCVETDVEGEAADIVGHLAERGHRTLGVLSLGRIERDGPIAHDPDVRRLLDSLYRFAETHRFTVRRNWIVTVPDVYHPDDAIRPLLASPDRPTALVCFHEDLNDRLLRLLGQAGLRCPEDISIIFRAAPEGSTQGLTHLAGDPEFMGQTAVRLLLQRIKSPQSPFVKVAVASRLVRGRTTGPAPADGGRSGNDR